MEVTLDRAGPDDALELLKLQYLCYQTEASRYDDWQLAALTQTLESMVDDIVYGVVLAARSEVDIIGSVRARLVDGTCRIGRLVVHPRSQGRGLGTWLMRAIMEHYPSVGRFELFTGADSADNLRLYARLGFREFRREQLNDRVELVHLHYTVDEI